MVNVAINGNGEVIREAKLPTSRRSLDDFFSTFTDSVKAIVERASNWYWLSDWCRGNGIDLTLAHPKMAGAISYAKVRTDCEDIGRIAQNGSHSRSLSNTKRSKRTPGADLQATLWNQAIKYNVRISGSQWRQLDELEGATVAPCRESASRASAPAN
ncbi:MAG: hypothetical protein U5K69_22245 [Balneolaceae bacterium]|nr:hypothetical protein [Balneolaceae bacterium]